MHAVMNMGQAKITFAGSPRPKRKRTSSSYRYAHAVSVAMGGRSGRLFTLSKKKKHVFVLMVNHNAGSDASPTAANTSRWPERIEQISRMKPGWNGYAAPEPSAQAISNARDFVRVLVQGGDEPTRIAPSAVGGVGVTFRNGTRKVYIEFFNDGSAHALFADDATQTMNTNKVETTASGYQDLLVKMREYLNG